MTAKDAAAEHPASCDAFIAKTARQGASAGPLAGLTFAAKDNFAIANHKAGAGHPDWRSTHDATARSATAVQMLLNAGADLIGATHMDELAFSLDGDNAHYGAPPNPAAPDRLTGGSSSGSASAVAAGTCDFALGTDTAGSIRVPASQCGLFGLRPSHGRVSVEGLVPLAPKYDTVGWFTRSAEPLRDVGKVLLGEDEKPKAIQTIILDPALFELVDEEYRPALLEAADSAAAPFGGLTKRDLNLDLDAITGMFAKSRSYDVWSALGDWIETAKPDLSPDVAARFADAAAISLEDAKAADAECAEFSSYLNTLLQPDEALILPITPDPAPLRTTESNTLANRRARLIQLSAIACVTGRPQVAFPALNKPAPIGLSLLGRKGFDQAMLDATCVMVP